MAKTSTQPIRRLLSAVVAVAIGVSAQAIDGPIAAPQGIEEDAARPVPAAKSSDAASGSDSVAHQSEPARELEPVSDSRDESAHVPGPASANEPVAIERKNDADAPDEAIEAADGAASSGEFESEEGGASVDDPTLEEEDSGAEAQAAVEAPVEPGLPAGDPGSGAGGAKAETLADAVDSDAAGDQKDAGGLPLPTREQRPLGPFATGEGDSAGSTADRTSVFSVDTLRTAGALLLVLGLIVGLRFALKRAARGGGGVAGQLGAGGRAPSGVLSVLGRYPVARGQMLVLLQLDRRILLVSQSGAGFQTLCEITDPEEVASLLVRTRDEEGDSLAGRFRTLLRRFERDPDIGAVDVEEIEVPSSGARQATYGDVFAESERIGSDAPTRRRAEPEGMDAVASLRRRLDSMRETDA